VNPPNCGRSIPEEKYGITEIKATFRGEPLALEELAGNLEGHDTAIVDLKVPGQSLETKLATFRPDVVGITGITCEANAVKFMARTVKQNSAAVVVVGGHHATHDPAFFNHPDIDYIAVGMAKRTFRTLIEQLGSGPWTGRLPGIARTSPGRSLRIKRLRFDERDLVQEKAPRYDLTARHRSHYTMASLDMQVGFVVSAYGCTHDCSFCSIPRMSGRRYLLKDPVQVIRDIGMLGDIPIIRFVDANTFGHAAHARTLAQQIQAAGIRKRYFADIRADTVVRHPDLMALWQETGLHIAVIGFEEINDQRLQAFNKQYTSDTVLRAVEILKDLGITIIGDFIVSPEYDEADFARLASFIVEHDIDIPIVSVLTPLPGTRLYEQARDWITIKDLDYYTFTNAVIQTKLPEDVFYARYAELFGILRRKLAERVS